MQTAYVWQSGDDTVRVLIYAADNIIDTQECPVLLPEDVETWNVTEIAENWIESQYPLAKVKLLRHVRHADKIREMNAVWYRQVV